MNKYLLNPSDIPVCNSKLVKTRINGARVLTGAEILSLLKEKEDKKKKKQKKRSEKETKKKLREKEAQEKAEGKKKAEVREKKAIETRAARASKQSVKHGKKSVPWPLVLRRSLQIRLLHHFHLAPHHLLQQQLILYIYNRSCWNCGVPFHNDL